MGKNLQMPFRMVDVVAIILVTQMMYLWNWICYVILGSNQTA